LGARRTRLIVLDRDGVINEDSDEYIKSPDEWRALPGSLDAIRRLNESGFDVVVATNQSGVGRGLFTSEALDGIHEHMLAAVAAAGGDIAGIYVCPHRPEDACDCRKPSPGLLKRIAADFERSLHDVPVVGDKLTDVECARAAGGRPIFIETERRAGDLPHVRALGVEVHSSLSRAVDALLAE
jgi:D-glycero-D-manno-heptose 1,7-bisphosphate phosphatase